MEMCRRAPAILFSAVFLVYLFRHPLELRLLRHRSSPRPDPSGEPTQVVEEKAPFTHLAGGKRYRLKPRFRWDESARVVGEERCDLPAQHVIALTASVEESVALINRTLKRVVIEPRDPLPSVRVHGVN